MILILGAVFVILVIVYFVKRWSRPENYPPGPRWLPILGNVPEIKKLAKALGGSHLAFSELSRIYKTNVLGLLLGGDYTVVVFSYPIVKTILTEEIFEGRPENFFMRLRSMGTRKGITGTDGDLWTIQRHFLTRHLRNLGFGKKPMELSIKEEVSEFLKILEKNKSCDTQIGLLLAPSIINIFWALTTGSRISRDDPRLEKLLNLLQKRTKAFDMSGGTLNTFPWLRFFAPEKTGYNLIMKMNKELYGLFMETIQEHYDTWSEERSDDLIFAFISEMKSGRPNTSTFTDDQLVMVCLDLFIAGSQTTSNTLDFAFLMMIMHPEIQKKVQKHLDEALEKDEPVEYSDRHKVPYVEAVLLEVQRYCLVTPIIGPRRSLKETVLDGYHIPKNTTILISLHSVHNDIEHWKDPEVFRPERFLDENGKLTNQERVIPFGLGRRRCLGEILARNSIFTFFSEVLRKYEINIKPGSKEPTGIPQPGITMSPESYRAIFVDRY